jgi:myo-inositol-1(or 4)-monophosphatase
VCAAVYNPITDEMFFAEKGAGAFKEGFRSHERLRVAGTKNIERALFGCGADMVLAQKALQTSPNLNVSGCVALDLAYLAAGKLDIAVAQNASLTSLAAGLLLVKEAGGYVTAIGQADVRSEDLQKVLFDGNIIATNEALRQKAADLFA